MVRQSRIWCCWEKEPHGVGGVTSHCQQQGQGCAGLPTFQHLSIPAPPFLLLFSACWSGVALLTFLAVSPCSYENDLDLRMQILFNRHTNMVSFATQLPKSFTRQAVCSGFVFQFWNSNFMPGCTVHSCVFLCVVSEPRTASGVRFCKFCRFLWISRGLCLWGK